MPVPTIKLNNGHILPVIGLSTKCYVDFIGLNAAMFAIDLGYRYFDTAASYFNEQPIGLGIRLKINQGVVRREDIFIATRLWNTYHEPHMVERACRNSLNKLGLDYIDLYLMHTPMGYAYRGDSKADLVPRNRDGTIAFNEVDYVQTYKAMEKLVEIGLVRSIGVSNFNSEQIYRVIANCRVKPVLNQIEVTPVLSQEKLRKYCKDRDILVVGHSPLGYLMVPKPPIFSNPKITDIGRKYGKTAEQVVLRYFNQLGVVLIPNSTCKRNMMDNINIFDFELNAVEMSLMESFDTGTRPIDIFNSGHKYYPFNIEY